MLGHQTGIFGVWSWRVANVGCLLCRSLSRNVCKMCALRSIPRHTATRARHTPKLKTFTITTVCVRTCRAFTNCFNDPRSVGTHLLPLIGVFACSLNDAHGHWDCSPRFYAEAAPAAQQTPGVVRREGGLAYREEGISMLSVRSAESSQNEIVHT